MKKRKSPEVGGFFIVFVVRLTFLAAFFTGLLAVF